MPRGFPGSTHKMSLILCKPARVGAAGGGEGAGELRDSYDRVAAEYTRRIASELDGKPFDRALLDRLADELLGAGPVCDLGCGPGHVGRYLADRGVEVVGVDLSPGMLDEARRRNPGMTFLEGDMRALPVPDGSWAAIVCFYAIVHLAPEELPAAFAEFRRVLRPGGRVVVAFHIGDEVVHTEEWWDQPVRLDFVFHRTDDVVAALERSGFQDVTASDRDPYPDVEHPSRRAYVEGIRA
jgi:SAM-dependent methyltransferase